MTRIRISEDNLFPWLLAGSLVLSLLLAAATALLINPRFGLSVLAGGVLASANFIYIRRGLEAALSALPANASRFALIRFLLRLVIMAVLLYVLIVQLGANVIGVVLGLSVLVLNIIILSIYMSTRKGG